MMTRATILILASALFALSLAASAQQTDSPLKSAMKILDFATDVGPPADFVLQSRPPKDPDYIPIFQPPPEPAKPAMNDKELTSVKGDLDSVEKNHDSLRKGFPPSAKALADQQAAGKKPKPPAPNQ
jgi:hypothetical protein